MVVQEPSYCFLCSNYCLVVSFCSLGFLSLWIFGKLSVFSRKRGQGWRLVVGMAPLILAMMVALSRTSDYHHHWQVLPSSDFTILPSSLPYGIYCPSTKACQRYLRWRGAKLS
ncbi:hypothetical protein OTU49_000583 [Cherax quadricarinatus]|uniref:Uncharacterized protein n=1 Tax=Cherax quadricarinatus TaxID=27406 RepID=A0AAW0XXS3_CHEQU